MAGGASTKVVQITNIAPQATKDHMQQLFQTLGKIDEIRLYPIARDAAVSGSGRICYIKFEESSSVSSAQHMSNTVFIDRVLICTPISSGVIPEEHIALEMAATGTLANGNNYFESKLPSEVVSRIEGQMPNQVIKTYDPKLENAGLPEYPPLPVNYDDRKIEETRRTILVLNVESGWRLEDLMEHFKRAGDVKYARFAETDNRQKIVMIEFCEQRSVVSALKMQGSSFSGTHLNLYHSTQPITKPEAKSNEAAQREVEEAMNIVNNIQLSAVIDPALSYLEKVRNPPSRSRSRSRSRSHTSYSRSKRSRSRRRSSSRRRRKRSTSRRRSRTRSRSRSKRRKRSSSRSRRSRSRSKDKRRRRDKKSRDRSRSRHKHSSRNRSRSLERRDRSKSRDRSRSRRRSDRKKKREKRDERKSYSRSRSKSHTRRSPSREKATSKKRTRSSRSAERKLKKISEDLVRDYDAEEKIGMDDNGCEKASSKSDNMDISP